MVRRVAALLLSVLIALVAINVVVVAAQQVTGRFGGVREVIDLDSESGVATWYAVVLLFTAALQLAVIAVLTRARGERARAWAWLVVVFVALSVDEHLALHERSAEPLRAWLNVSGVLHYAWVIPGVLFVAVVGAAFVPFLRGLPATIRNPMLLAAALYVTGALGMEMVGGWIGTRSGPTFVGWAVVVVEETLELLGASVMVIVLTEQLRRLLPPAITAGASRA